MRIGESQVTSVDMTVATTTPGVTPHLIESAIRLYLGNQPGYTRHGQISVGRSPIGESSPPSIANGGALREVILTLSNGQILVETPDMPETRNQSCLTQT